ncbi:MAG: biotin--[acetyl-CoA-carboxylase] ligase [Spirochaetota bacterium]
MKELDILHPFSKLPVYFSETVDSTMEAARQIYSQQGHSGIVVVAEHQNKGRGRGTDRSWYDVRGASLLMTLVLSDSELAFPLSLLPLGVGLGVAEHLELLCRLHVQIKWPNDIIVDDRKLAGILCEHRGNAVYIGIGVNCGGDPAEAWQLTANNRYWKPVSLEQMGCSTVAPLELLPGLLKQLHYRLTLGLQTSEIEDRLYNMNREIVFLPGSASEATAQSQMIRGRLMGIDEFGGIKIQERDYEVPRVWYAGELQRKD